MSNIASIIVAHHATLVAAATKLQAGKPVWYDEPLVALRQELEAHMVSHPETALSVLAVTLANEARRGQRIVAQVDGKQKLLINWSGFGFGHAAGHRALAQDLCTKYKGLTPVEAVKLLTEEEKDLMVKVAKRYTKQIVLKLITTTKV